MGNHFHLKLKPPTRECFQKFLRSIRGRIARLVTGAKKGKSFGQKFWDELAFSRVLKTQIEELQLKGYFKANRIQRVKGYQARVQFLNSFNNWIENLKLHQANHSKPSV